GPRCAHRGVHHFICSHERVLIIDVPGRWSRHRWRSSLAPLRPTKQIAKKLCQIENGAVAPSQHLRNMTESTCLWCQRMVRLLRDSMAVLLRARSAFCSITERHSSSAYVLPLILVYGMLNGRFAAVWVPSTLGRLPGAE